MSYITSRSITHAITWIFNTDNNKMHFSDFEIKVTEYINGCWASINANGGLTSKQQKELQVILLI